MRASCSLGIAWVRLNLTLPPDELRNDDDYRDIIQDVQEECAKSGCPGGRVQTLVLASLPHPGVPLGPIALFGPFLAFARWPISRRGQVAFGSSACHAPRSSRVPSVRPRSWPAVAKWRPSAVADSTLAVCHSSAAAWDRARPARDGREGHHPPPPGASPRLDPSLCCKYPTLCDCVAWRLSGCCVS